MTTESHQTPHSMRPQDKASRADAPNGDFVGRLITQTGPRTTAPMWPRPLLTPSEFIVYVTLWSFANWNGTSTFPTHQALSDRAWVERGTAADAVHRMVELGLLIRQPQKRADGSSKANDYLLIEVCPPHLAQEVAERVAGREDDQAAKRKKRKAANRASAARTAARRAEERAREEEGGTAQAVPRVRLGPYPRGTA